MRSLTRPPTIQNRSSQNKFYDDLLKQKYTQQLGRRAGGGKGQQYLCQAKTLGMIPVDESVWNKLTREEKQEIEQICDEKSKQYYSQVAEKYRSMVGRNRERAL